jgi:hypothetical protein
MTCTNIKNTIELEHFEKLLKNSNKYEILLSWINTIILENKDYEINIMVGCTNESEGDYNRFKDDNKYSFYININVDNDNIQAIKEYNMFTIDYNDLDENFPENSISNIHFDTGTSNFTPIEYLSFAEKVLKTGGKIVYDLIDHGGCIFKYNDDTKLFETFNGEIMDNSKIKNLENIMSIKIDFENKKIIPDIEAGYYERCCISPQMNIIIIYELYKKRFLKYPEQGYIEYCANKYRLLTFEEKHHNYINYSYPVKMRIIDTEHSYVNLFNELMNFIVNKVMSIDERLLYINDNKISYYRIVDLCVRITSNNELSQKIKEYIPSEILKICKCNSSLDDCDLNLILEEYLVNVFSEKLRYVECTKK